MKIGIILYSGYNTRGIVAFCRWLRNQQISSHIVANGPADPILFTDFSRCVFHTRQTPVLDPRDQLDLLNQIKKTVGYDRLLIVPSSEYLNRFFLTNREYFENHGVIVPLVPKELYECISDKKSFSIMCSRDGILIPTEYTDIPDEFPFVAKPMRYFSRDHKTLRPYLINNSRELQSFMKTENPYEFYFQEYLEGQSFYLMYYISKYNEHVVFSQENLIQQYGGGSIIAAVSSTMHQLPLSNQFLVLLKRNDFHGLIMIELKRRGQEYFMIEANPRLWGPMQLLIDANCPFFDRFLGEWGVELLCRAGQFHDVSNSVYYFWSGGMVGSHLQRGPIAFHNYSASMFFEDFSRLIQSDIYLRNDTILLYKTEMGIDW